MKLSKKKDEKKKVMISEQKSEHTIIILGDSHACSLAERLKVTLKDNFEIIGYIKPNCNIKT
jgi:hypothetical protein